MRQRKQSKKKKLSLQTGRLKKNNESYSVDNKCKCVNEMSLSVFIVGL